MFLSSHLLAEVEQLCSRVGVLDRGRLVLQETLAEVHAPTGLVVVETPDLQRAHDLLDGRIERVEGNQLFVRAEDSAQLNILLVDHGILVHSLGPERRTLEQVVLAATHAGTDRVDGRTAQVGTGA